VQRSKCVRFSSRLMNSLFIRSTTGGLQGSMTVQSMVTSDTSDSGFAVFDPTLFRIFAVDNNRMICLGNQCHSFYQFHLGAATHTRQLSLDPQGQYSKFTMRSSWSDTCSLDRCRLSQCNILSVTIHAFATFNATIYVGILN